MVEYLIYSLPKPDTTTFTAVITYQFRHAPLVWQLLGTPNRPHKIMPKHAFWLSGFRECLIGLAKSLKMTLGRIHATLESL